MKKPGAISAGKSGFGSMGKGGLGSSGKSGLSSIGKSGMGSSKSASSGKTGGLLGSSGKSGTSKSGMSPTSKSGLSPTAKSGLSLSKTSSSSSPKPSKSFDFIPSGKPTSLAPTSSSYNAYGNPKTGKSRTFGIIWIPTKKRNKNKDMVLSSQHKEDRRRERSPSFYKIMSGDSPYQPDKKKEEEDLLVLPDRKLPIGNSAAPEMTPGNAATTSNDDKQHLIRQDTEESKEAAGDTLEKGDDSDDDKDYLNNDDDTVRKNLPDTLTEKDTFGDKVDSVYLRPPPPHKARSNASNTEEESCGMKCLYYTLQCCDCVLM